MTPANERPPLALRVPKAQAYANISDQITRGKLIEASFINPKVGLETVLAERAKWKSYVEELLRQLFTNHSLAHEFGTYVGACDDVDSFRMNVRAYVNRLDSILARVEVIPELHDDQAATTRRTSASRKVFVVHGHNDAARLDVCRFLEKLKLEPVVLHEQPSKGKTVIEKIEANSDVHFAVVIITGDDLGCPKDKSSALVPRARQNVIAELGYFVGRIGRDRVCALYEGGVDIPSDFNGVVYVSMVGTGWRLELARELKAAKIDIDLNLVVT